MKSKYVTLRGILAPESWDNHETVTSTILMTDTEEDYYIHNDKKGKELNSMLKTVIEVQGFIKQDHLNDRTLIVKNYRRLS